MGACPPSRPHARRRLLLTLAVLGIMAFPLASGTPAAQSETILAPSTGALRICTDCSNYGLSDGSRYSYAILHAWDYPKIARLKNANPRIKVLVYKDASASVSYACRNGTDDAMLPAGVGYCSTNTNHPEWFLKDASGSRIEFCDYSSTWLMDVGNPDYQRAWLQNTVADAKKYGFDGVMLDDVVESMDNHLCGKGIAKYPTDADWARATSSFMAAVGPGLKSQGLLAFPNVTIKDYWTSTGLAHWDTWLSYSSGAVQEYYTKWSKSSSSWFTDDGGWHNDWSYRQAYLRRTQAAGKPYIGITYGPKSDAHSQRYARGSFLLDWDGGPSSLIYEPSDPEAQDPYNSIWTTSLGAPLGSRYQAGVAWRRNYAGGTVVVNPSTGPVTVSLGGTFAQSDGTLVSSVTVPSADAAVLVNAATTPTVAVPVNTGLPTISGAVQDGQALSASAGSWSGSPTGYAYQWLRCNSSGASCIAVLGSTSTGYRLGPADVGFAIRVRATASNSAGSAAATSAPTANITALSPTNSALPVISISRSRTSATASTGTWTGSPATFVYQWLRCGSSGGSCVAIAGAVNQSYIPSASDVGKTLRVKVTARNSGGSASAASAQTAAVKAVKRAKPAFS
jgi:hypothetical protein